LGRSLLAGVLGLVGVGGLSADRLELGGEEVVGSETELGRDKGSPSGRAKDEATEVGLDETFEGFGFNAAGPGDANQMRLEIPFEEVVGQACAEEGLRDVSADRLGEDGHGGAVANDGSIVTEGAGSEGHDVRRRGAEPPWRTN
jgi:hypothetical protein